MPINLIQEAALAWLKQQDLSGKTPTETFEMLDQAVKDIQAAQPKNGSQIGFN